MAPTTTTEAAPVEASAPRPLRVPVCALEPWERRWKLPKQPRRTMQFRDQFRWAITVGLELGELSLLEHGLLAKLNDLATPSGNDITVIERATIGKAVQRQVSTTANALRRLRTAGWIDWHHNIHRTPEGHCRQRGNTYRILIPAYIAEELDRRRELLRKRSRKKPAPQPAKRTRNGNRRVQSRPGRPYVPEPVVPPPFVPDPAAKTNPGAAAAAIAGARSKLQPKATPAKRSSSKDPP